MIALAHPEPADLRRRDIHVGPPGQKAARPHEAVTLVADLEQALNLDRVPGRLEGTGFPLPLTLPLTLPGLVLTASPAALARRALEAPIAAPPPPAAAAALAEPVPVTLGTLAGPVGRDTGAAALVTLVALVGGGDGDPLGGGATRRARGGLAVDGRRLGRDGRRPRRPTEGEPLGLGWGPLGAGRLRAGPLGATGPGVAGRLGHGRVGARRR